MVYERIQLVVPGRPVEATPDADVRRLLNIQPITSYQIQTIARGEMAPQTPLEGPADAIVKLEYESGLVEWLRLDQFRAELGESRAAEPVPVPAVLNRGAGPTRGATDWVLKAMHVFEISPLDELANQTADVIVGQLEGKLDTGLFRLKPDGTFGDRIEADKPLAADSRPYLIFIHGTASSTTGSFGGFWLDQGTDEWKALLTMYKDRILALEHRTMSVSPAQNTLDLIRLLPPTATVHVITHSRGGLVGELLGLNSWSDDDLKSFEQRPDLPLLEELQAELAQKELTVAKFVRTACPAAGTILASKRLDLYLNVILNVIGLIPGLAENPAYAIFKAVALQLIKLRADPSKIPGLEAQMPESPFIHLLNTRGRFSDADLGVIAGDFDGSGVWGTLKTYALRAYYLEDNDLVVNTRSMSGGMERKKGVWQFLDQGSTVNHFNYFRNARTRAQMLSWLSAPPAQPAPEFTRVRGVEPRAATRGAEQLPIAFIVPDMFGTHLVDQTKNNVWLNYDELAKGRFLELQNSSLTPGRVSDAYLPLYEALGFSHDTVLFPYDWRQAITKSAESLAEKVTEKLAGQKRNLCFIAHGMGGLVVREFARQDPERWERVCGETGGLLMLGTPIKGSWHITRLLAGRSRLVRMIALLGRHTDAQVVGLLLSCQGLIDLLPDEMLDPARWNAMQLGRPAPDALQATRQWREQIGNFKPAAGRNLYVAGSAAATPSGMDDYTTEGDGQVTYSLGIPEQTRTWYSANAHGNLVSQPKPLIQLLNTGAAGALDTKPYPPVATINPQDRAAREEIVFFPSEKDLVSAALGLEDRLAGAEETMVRVKVAHGHLREAKYPVAVGHYVSDGIVSAEVGLDRQLGGRLSTRFYMGLYPGRAGTAEVVRAPEAHPPGALIAGLGEVGEITPDKVRHGMLEACLRYALMRSEEPASNGNQPRSAAFSSMLIGTSGGRAISIADSVKSIVSAAVEANRILQHRNLWDRVRIDEVEFIELYEQTAIEAAHAAAKLQVDLKNDLLPGERIVFDGRLRTLPGGQVRPPANEYATGWWRRIRIAEDRGVKDNGPEASTALVFENLTDRARAEETSVSIQTRLFNSLLQEATQRSS